MTKVQYPQDQAIRRRAAMLSVLMHVLLFLAMIFMVDWKAVHVNPSVMEATLWDSLPSKQVNRPVVEPPEPVPPEPEPAPKPPEPAPPEKVTPPEPQVDKAEQAAEIALKKREDEKRRKLEQEKKEEEKKKQEEKLKKIQEALRKEEQEEKLKKMQEAMRQQDMDAQHAATASAAVDPSVLGYYMGLLNRKIRSNVNRSLCPAANATLLFEMQLTGTGDISGMPKLVKGSGDAVCDDAVLRAILAAKPFDLPGEDHAAERKKMLEQIRATFKPRG